jgi:hypothetical protein
VGAIYIASKVFVFNNLVDSVNSFRLVKYENIQRRSSRRSQSDVPKAPKESLRDMALPPSADALGISTSPFGRNCVLLNSR